jgi:hypothetical protein
LIELNPTLNNRYFGLGSTEFVSNAAPDSSGGVLSVIISIPPRCLHQLDDDLVVVADVTILVGHFERHR